MIQLLLGLTLLLRHPIHTTVLELRWDARARVVEGTLRAFEDDLLAASGKAGLGATEYVLRHVSIAAGGDPVTLTACGERKAADAVLVCLRGSVRAPSPMRVRNTMLMELHADQINIVRLDRGAATTFLLTRTDSEQVAR